MICYQEKDIEKHGLFKVGECPDGDSASYWFKNKFALENNIDLGSIHGLRTEPNKWMLFVVEGPHKPYQNQPLLKF